VRLRSELYSWSSVRLLALRPAGDPSDFSSAYAITYMDGVGNLASWRWLFILEVNQCIPFLSFAYKRQGLATMLLSLVVLFGLPDSPERAHWLTADERGEVIALRASVGGGHYENEDFKWKHLRQALTDIRVACCVWLCECSACRVVLTPQKACAPTSLS
jgi:hypothetical protein